jgi:transcriptional regulator NrdR family protein
MNPSLRPASDDDHSDGVSCPVCGRERSQVVDTRARSREHCIWRRRRCQDCDARFSTTEKVTHTTSGPCAC